MSEFDQWAMLAIKEYYLRSYEGCKNVVEYVNKSYKRKPRYWRRFMLDFKEWKMEMES